MPPRSRLTLTQPEQGIEHVAVVDRCPNLIELIEEASHRSLAAPNGRKAYGHRRSRASVLDDDCRMAPSIVHKAKIRLRRVQPIGRTILTSPPSPMHRRAEYLWARPLPRSVPCSGDRSAGHPADAISDRRSSRSRWWCTRFISGKYRPGRNPAFCRTRALAAFCGWANAVSSRSAEQ